MFPYLGNKQSIVSLYPLPIHDEIIEPFAGSARYSLLHWKKKITLIERDPAIIEVWKWLKEAQPDDVLKLPRLKLGEDLRNYKQLSKGEALLLGLLITKHSNRPRFIATSWATNHRPNHINYHLKRISKNLFKIKHWDIQLGSYELAVNRKATWFIDPPYTIGGRHYKYGTNKINQGVLKEFCLSRLGQVIVCEGTGANWLPFRDLTTKRTTWGTIQEKIFTLNNGETIYFQPYLF